MKNVEDVKKAIENIKSSEAKTKKAKNVNISKKISIEKENTTNNDSVSEAFYLETKVKKLLNESESRRKIEIEKVSKECEQEEIKGQKYIEALKAEMLERYKAEQDKCQKKIDKLKTQAMKKIEDKMKKEQQAINEMCKTEILSAINKFAAEKGWFELGVALYKANPSLFDK